MLGLETGLTLNIFEQSTAGRGGQCGGAGHQAPGGKLHALAGPLPHTLNLHAAQLRVVHRDGFKKAAQGGTGREHRTATGHAAPNHALSVLGF